MQFLTLVQNGLNFVMELCWTYLCKILEMSNDKFLCFILDDRNIAVGTSTAAARIGSLCSPFIVFTVSKTCTVKFTLCNHQRSENQDMK